MNLPSGKLHETLFQNLDKHIFLYLRSEKLRFFPDSYINIEKMTNGLDHVFMRWGHLL